MNLKIPERGWGIIYFHLELVKKEISWFVCSKHCYALPTGLVLTEGHNTLLESQNAFTGVIFSKLLIKVDFPKKMC